MPSAPLDPNTAYEVTSVVANRGLGQEKGGNTTSSTSFTTGTTRLQPLAFGGALTITFQDRDHEVCLQDTGNNCGGRASMGVRSDRTVLVDVPAPVGGDAARGFLYRARADLNAADREC